MVSHIRLDVASKWKEPGWLASEPSFWVHFDVALRHQAPGLIPLNSGTYTLTWSPESPSYWTESATSFPGSLDCLHKTTTVVPCTLCENESKLPSKFPLTDKHYTNYIFWRTVILRTRTSIIDSSWEPYSHEHVTFQSGTRGDSLLSQTMTICCRPILEYNCD